MEGTTLYSTIYYGVATLVVLFAIWSLFKVWRPVSLKIGIDNTARTLTSPIIKTIAIVIILMIVLVLGWNTKQHFTSTLSTYQSPEEQAEQKKIEESRLPTQEEMDKKRAEQREKTDIKPQEDAFKSFDEQMKKEADKIKERNK
jgi:hypothetical protein